MTVNQLNDFASFNAASARRPGMRPAGSPIPVDRGSQNRSNGKAWARRAILFCASAILSALAIYIVTFFGFNAAVKCHVDNYRLLHRSPTTITEIVSSNGCGF